MGEAAVSKAGAGIQAVDTSHSERGAAPPGARGHDHPGAHRERGLTKRSPRWCRHRQASREKRAFD